MSHIKLARRSSEKPRDIVTNTIGKMIVSGEFAPGSRLPTETELGEQMSVSRTALRESVRTLAGKGLVESRPRIGTVVLPQSQWNQLDPDLLKWREDLPPDLNFVRSLIEAREVIEPAAARLAAMRATGQDLGHIQSAFDAMRDAEVDDIESGVAADEAFHLAILTASKNPVFANFAAVIGSALRNSFRLTTTASKNYQKTLEKHGDVLEAIRMRNGDAASRQMSELIEVASVDLARLNDPKNDP
jgi:GntR family galactonate operon transcriptional repressor